MKSTRTLLRLTAAALLAVTAVPAHAVLLDHGPADPTLVFPIWYRDLNGLALKECLSAVPSPNPGALGKPMCFPINPDPAGFPGNVGPELFYNDLVVSLAKGGAGGSGFSLKYVAALEGSYLPAGVPLHGTEAVFGRIRIIINTGVAGTYKVTHPFGVEVFNVRPADLGPRAVFFTADVPLAVPNNFDLALNGRIGPFMQWDFVDPGLSLTNSAGEQFVGDPGFNHTYTGSPFLTNFVRVDGPPGSNLDGVGNDFIQSPLANVTGQKYLAPIPTPLQITKSYYTRDPVTNVIGINVAAKSAPGQQMILTGSGMPSVTMNGDALGNYFSHVEMPATAIPPASVTVTNATSVPPNGLSAALVDLVNITSATFDSLTKTLAVAAVSSDKLAPGPVLAVTGPLGGLMTAGAYSTILPAGALPPLSVSVDSGAGGVDTDAVLVLPGLNDAVIPQPVALSSVWTTNENTAIVLPLGSAPQLTLVGTTTLGSIVIVSNPTNGTVAVGAGGAVTYTPALNFFSGGTVPPDSFQYVAIDSAGAVSNVATATVNVVFVPVGPTANPDDFAMIANKATPLASRTINVVANDVASAGTTINPASVVITTLPLHGTLVNNLNGTVTYTPVLNYVGADSFVYTVANTAGVASTPATVSIVVEGGAESLSMSKANFTLSKNQWTLVGSTNWFGPTLLHTTVTCWVGKGTGGTAGPLIGTAPVDGTGKFSLVPPSLTTPPPDATNIFTCQTSNSLAPAGTTVSGNGVVIAVVTRI